MAETASKLFILVHGAWHGGWCWSRVEQRLRDQGCQVLTPTLSGLSDRAAEYHDAIDLADHVRDVVSLIVEHDLRDIVLCGHSYGGMVITGVAAELADRIASIVYLDAFLPMSGQSASDISGFVPQPGPVPPRTAESLGIAEADREWVTALLTPQPSRTFTTPVANVDALDRIGRKTYVLATVGAPPFFIAAHARAQGAADWHARQIECGHDAMIISPDDVVELLIEAAR